MKKIVTLFITISIIFSHIAFAQDFNEEIIGKNFHFTQEIKNIGVNSTESVFFTVDKKWEIQDGYLNLILSKSELINEDESTLTIVVNKTPIYSTKLNETKDYKETIRIPIPKENIIQGFNEIQIKTYKRISEKPCEDDINSANWIVFHEDSFIHLDFKELKDYNSLQDFPYPYIKESDIKSSVNIIIPDDFTEGEITSSMIISGYIGRLSQFKEFTCNLLKTSKINEVKNNNLIYIGSLNSAPKEVSELLTEKEKNNLSKEAILKEVNSPYEHTKKLLLIVSENDEMLKKATKFILNGMLVENTKEQVVVINESTKVLELNKKKNTDISLKDLGYDHILLEGPFAKETKFSLSIPKNRTIEKDSNIILKFKYAKNLDFDRSLVTIYVNEIPIGSHKMYMDKADDDELKVTIPESLRNTNSYDIKVKFNLEVKDLICDTTGKDTPWAYISNESCVHLPYKDSKKLIFENYPYPFVREGNFDDVIVVIPDNINDENMKSLSSIVAYIGQDLESNNGNINVIKSSNFKGDYKNKNLIYLGTPNDNIAIKEINEKLNIKFNESFTAFESNDKIQFTENYGKNISAIQLIKSPYNKDKAIMVVTSPNNESLSYSEKYLTNNNLLKKLKGDGAIIDKDGKIQNEYYQDIDENIEDNSFEKFKIDKNTKILAIFFTFILLMVLGTVVFTYKKYKN